MRNGNLFIDEANSINKNLRKRFRRYLPFKYVNCTYCGRDNRLYYLYL